MQVIEIILNTPHLHQPMRILPDPPQTTLKANQILYFTTILSIDRNFLPPEERRCSAVGVE